jgi:hypothetical protein
VANSTAVITDLNTVIAAGPSATTAANAVNPAGQSVSGGAGGLTNGSGVYASGTYYGGIMDYVGNCKLVLLKCQEIAVLLARIAAVTDSGDGQQANIIKILNDFQ